MHSRAQDRRHDSFFIRRQVCTRMNKDDDVYLIQNQRNPERRRIMPERPHSRKVKTEEGYAEVKKGEKIETTVRASERTAEEAQKSKDRDEEN